MYYPREAQKDNLYTQTFLPMLLIIPLALVLALAKGDATLHARASISPTQAIGTIEKITPDEESPNILHIHYQFQTKDNTTLQGIYSQNKLHDKSLYATGQNIPIIYSKLFPNSSISEYAHNASIPGFYIFMSCIFLIFCCLCYSGWSLIKLRKHTEEDINY